MLVARSAGVHLSKAGHQHAERLARHLAPEKIEHILSSPLERAQETAAPLARLKGLDVVVSEAIHECDFGGMVEPDRCVTPAVSG